MKHLHLTVTKKALPCLQVEFPPEMPEDQIRQVQKAIQTALLPNEIPRNYEAPASFREMATFIYRVYGHQSDLWRLFLHRLCPTAIPQVVWAQYEDKDLTLEEFLTLLPVSWEGTTPKWSNTTGKTPVEKSHDTSLVEEVLPLQWFEGDLADILRHALRFSVWEASRRAVSHARKARVTKKTVIQGIQISIDRPIGFVQSGYDSEGNAWNRVYQCDYGFIPGTDGGDGEDLDVFIGNFPENPLCYLIEQKKDDGSFDEWKVMLGFASEGEAKSCYTQHIPAKYMSGCYPLPVAALKNLLGISPTQVKKHLQTSQKALRRQFKTIAGASKEAEQYILGIVLVPEEPDLQGEIYSAEVIRTACHTYMEYYRQIGDQHRRIMVYGGDTPETGAKASLVECYLAPVSMVIENEKIPEGTWLVGMKFYDKDYWKKIETGQITGLSMGGYVQTEED